VLRRKIGETFDVGVIDGPRGKASLLEVEADALRLDFSWGEPPPPLAPIRLLVGLPRPQTARDLLREGASLGIAAMDFVRTDRAEASYAQSSLWTSTEWKNLLVAGAAQAFCTRLPEVRHGRALAAAIETLPPTGTRIALDNYEAAAPLSVLAVPESGGFILAVGAERGWSDRERTLLRDRGFVFAHLGSRVLRTETACIAAITLLQAKLGCL